MLEYQKKIVLDTDGVLVDFVQKFHMIGQEILQRELPIIKNRYDIIHKFNITRDEENLIWSEIDKKKHWDKFEPLEGVQSAVEEIKRHNFEIYIVTGIKEDYKEERLKNLANLGIVPQDIHCVGDGRSRKDFAINAINPDVFVDDRLEHLHMVPDVYHLVWIDHGEEQHPIKDKRVDVQVKSLKEWVDNHLEEVAIDLDYKNKPQQKKLRFI